MDLVDGLDHVYFETRALGLEWHFSGREFAWAFSRTRFKGHGVVHRSGGVFQRGCQIYRDAGVVSEIRAVVLIGVDRALPLLSPAYDRGGTEQQVKDRWRRYWGKLWEGVEE
jgi:hypothetical protein